MIFKDKAHALKQYSHSGPSVPIDAFVPMPDGDQVTTVGENRVGIEFSFNQFVMSCANLCKHP
jgi:hypothetical protein